MKKFVLILMSIVTLLSVFMMTACGETASTSSSGSFTAPSSSAKPSKIVATSKEITTTSDDEGDTSNGTPTSSITSIAISGSSLYIPTTPVPEGASMTVMLLVSQINNIEAITPDNYKEKIDIIYQAEATYNTLSQAEKNQVTNYNYLLQAKALCDEYAAAGTLVDFQGRVNALPDASQLRNVNVEAVYEVYNMLNANKTYLQTNLKDFSTYESKVNACYQKVIDSLVERAIIAQDLDGNGIMQSSAVNPGDGKLKNELTGEKKRTDTGDGFFKFDKSVSSGSQTNALPYSDKKNPNPVSIWQYYQGNCTFTAPCPGTVTIYVRKGNSREYAAKQNGATVFSFSSGSTDDTCIKSFEVTTGAVSIEANGGTAYFCAVKFSYPNLG